MLCCAVLCWGELLQLEREAPPSFLNSFLSFFGFLGRLLYARRHGAVYHTLAKVNVFVDWEEERRGE